MFSSIGIRTLKSHVKGENRYRIYLNIKDKEIKSKKLFYKLKVKGVYITPGAIFYRELNLGESYFKIGFSQVTEDEISRGINIIREGLKQWHI